MQINELETERKVQKLTIKQVNLFNCEGENFYGLHANLVVLDGGCCGYLLDLGKIFVDHVDEIKTKVL